MSEYFEHFSKMMISNLVVGLVFVKIHPADVCFCLVCFFVNHACPESVAEDTALPAQMIQLEKCHLCRHKLHYRLPKLLQCQLLAYTGARQRKNEHGNQSQP